MLGGYTFSKSTDNGSGIRTLNGDTLFPQNSFCLDCEWGLSVFDVRHRFVASVLYELPFGDGKPFMQDGIGGAILGGWQVSTIIIEVERVPANGLRRHRQVEYRRRPGPSERRRRTGSDPAGRSADDRAVVQHRRVRAEPLGTFGNAGRNTFYRSGHHQRRRVDHPELPDQQQFCFVGLIGNRTFAGCYGARIQISVECDLLCVRFSSGSDSIGDIAASPSRANSGQNALPSASLLCSLAVQDVVSRQRTANAFECKIADRFNRYVLLNRHQHAGLIQYLPGLCFVAKPRRDIGYRPNGGVVKAPLKTDGA